MPVERRRQPRYRVKDNAFAVINDEPVKLVPILDIAMGGLGVYVHEGALRMNESSKLEIMLADCSFYMENLPFELISNFKAFPARPANLLDGRRFSLKFGKLMPRQKSQLIYFIRNYTEGRVMLQLLQRFNKLLHPSRAPKYAGQSCNTGIWQGLHRPTF
jgi:c-di-GMP-binding flagellar brake protein YcgR